MEATIQNTHQQSHIYTKGQEEARTISPSPRDIAFKQICWHNAKHKNYTQRTEISHKKRMRSMIATCKHKFKTNKNVTLQGARDNPAIRIFITFAMLYTKSHQAQLANKTCWPAAEAKWVTTTHAGITAANT